MKKTAIIYLLCNDEPEKYLENALKGVISQTYPKENMSLTIVYNPVANADVHLQYINETISLFSAQLPKTVVLPQEINIGFSAGNNVGMKWAIENNFNYVFLHNGDGYLQSSAIESMVGVLEKDEKIGQVQALMLLDPENDLINSAGNNFHYLGIGYCANFRQPVRDFKFVEIADIGYASGAATMLRVDLLKKFGLWNESFFLYHEDTEYSLRLKIKGYRICLAGKALFYHRYEFNKKKYNKFYWIERNRHVLQLLFYRWPTIILLLPLEILYNLGLIVYSAIAGWLPGLVKVYIYWLQPKNWRFWLKARREIQKDRRLSDRELIFGFSVTVDSEVILSKVIRQTMNAVFTIYNFLLKILMHW